METNPALTIAVIGASVSVIGWIVNYILSSLQDRRREKIKFQIEFTQKQLEELYGPLAFLVLEGRRTFQELLLTLERDHVFYGDNELPDDELKTWLFWVENDFFPRNQKIIDLISNKTYLIEGPKVPASWLEFLDHANSWKINQARWEKDGIKYPWKSRVNWPTQFEQDVISAFEHLKNRHSSLVGQRAR